MSVGPGLYALLAIGVALATFVILYRRGTKIGQAMLLSAFVLAWLLGVTPQRWGEMLAAEWRDKALGETTPFLFVSLSGLVLLVNVLGAAMQETGVSRRLPPALHQLFRSRRAALAGIPFLMGMLPTPGGIMLSAPMVREMGDAHGIDRARQAAVNFFFRHQLETVWPLFPSVPLIQVMLHIPPARLLTYNLSLAVSGLAAGTAFLLVRGFPRSPGAEDAVKRGTMSSVRDFLHAFWPIALTAWLYAAFNVPSALGILVAVLAFLVLHRVPIDRWRPIAQASLEWDFVLLIMGALLYKLDLESVGAVGDITAFLRAYNVPVPVLLFGLPFLVAYVTGVTMPTVAMTFPLLESFIGQGAGVHMGLEVLAFGGVVCGLFLTPVHLCMALSASYFEVPLGRILRLVLLPAAAVAATAFAVALLAG
jgi:uncharacterized protein